MKKLVPLLVIALAGCLGPGEDPNGQPDSGGGAGDGSGGHGSGGAPGSGGSNGSGGAVSASGGQIGSGGTGSGGSGSGGTGSGGQGTGGRSGSGGFTATGGGTGSGGSGSGGKGSGGAVGSGGFAAAGGATGSGGSGSGGGGRGGASGMMGSGGSAAAVCTSKKMWTGGNGSTMRPGNDCTACHGFTIAGTLYPTQHEPNNCDGTAANGVKVVVTGADGKVTTLTPDATSGNFYSSTAIKAPFSAKVTNSAGGSRAMTDTQTKGNCNSCHTQDGASGAPGRIMTP